MEMSAGNRVCVPVTLPHNSMPAYAVLELVGFTSQPQSFEENDDAASLSSSEKTSSLMDGRGPTEARELQKNSRFSSSSSSSSKRLGCNMTVLHKKRICHGTKASSDFGHEGAQAFRKNAPAAAAQAPTASISTCATTFVQADSSSFRELVQKLTGAGLDCKKKMPVTCTPPGKSTSSKTKSGICSSGNRCQGASKLKLGQLLAGKNHMLNNGSSIFLDVLSRNTSPRTPLAFDPFGPEAASQLPSPSSCSNIDVMVDTNDFSNRSVNLPVIEKCSFLESPVKKEAHPELLPLFPVHSQEL